MIKRLYVGLIEVVPLNGCELDFEDIKGATVRLYIPADNFHQALDLLTSQIKEDLFELVDIEMLAESESVSWEKDIDATASELINQAMDNNSVVYGEFYAWNE